jgi:RNA-directed DNA polymerase
VNIYPDALDKELERRGHCFCRYADDCNIYVMRFQLLRQGSQAAAERTLPWIQDWIEKHLRFKMNAAKSGTGRVLAQELKAHWNGKRSCTSNQLRDEWNQYVRGWREYFQLTETLRAIKSLEPWVRRHIRKCFWLRWHSRRGRLRNLRRLGLEGLNYWRKS